MATGKIAELLTLVAACAFVSACATTHYTRSGIVALPPDVKGKAGSDASLEVEGLKLRIESLDRVPEKAAIPPLVLRLVFEPKQIGYAFDPDHVVLRGSDGTEWRPRVSGPGHFDTQGWRCATAGLPAAPEPGHHYLAPRSCFDLAFDVTVEKDARLSLVLDGLSRGHQPLAPVTLPLARRKGQTIDRVYWLEALLAPLAYAPYVH